MPVARTTYNTLIDDTGAGDNGSILTVATVDGLLDDVDTGIAGLTSNGTDLTQLKFAATQSASSNANTLDDYEEGTYTPTDGSGAGLTFASAQGNYVKVGQLVAVTVDVTYPTQSNTSQAKINLPFTATGTGISLYGGAIGFTNYGSGITSGPLAGTDDLHFWTLSGNNVTNANLSGLTVRVTAVFRATA
jgi:hypothetical protein